MGVVTNSVEFMRIFGLPRRALDFDSVEDVTPVFARPEGNLAFRPIQSAALIEASLADGLFAPIAVGAGKTLIALALPEAMDSQKTVLLVKPSLKKQLEREAMEFYSKHFDLPLDRITVIAYSELSSAKHAGILDDIQPDLIIADEAHALKNSTAARTKRFLRYAKANPGCRYAFLSGTMTHRSVLDYAHLIELALRKNSPLPRGYRELKDWAGALDVEPDYAMEPGVLRKFCTASEDVRDGFRRRLVESMGVVATSKGSVATSLVFRRQRPKMPANVSSFLSHTRDTWALGEREFDSAATMAAALKQVAHGFYYRWAWPDGVPDEEWLDAKRKWNREVRQKLSRSAKGMDSPLLLARAAERYRVWDQELKRDGPRPENAWDSIAWADWKAVKDRDEPPVEPVWIDDFLVDYAASWASKLKGHRGIIWYSWGAFGERLASKHGLPLYGPGRDASEATEDVIVCSIRSQGTGKNLQRYSHNLFSMLPPNGMAVEQTVGRTHRPGQLADEVIADWCAHTHELADAMDRVLQDAEYIERTTGQRQKVIYATHIH